LFNTLGTLVDLSGARVADLFAGTGAVGLEALSRGAVHALLVERDTVVLRTLRANAAAVALPGAEIRCACAEHVVHSTPEHPYDVVFLDPPYSFPDNALEKLLADIEQGGWLYAGGVCVVERDRRSARPVWPERMIAARERAYGEGVLWYGSRS
jgi:16S rRNA (guanine966-N2)-methyltransferase